MVHHILSNARRIDSDIDTSCFQNIRISNARKLEDLGRLERTLKSRNLVIATRLSSGNLTSRDNDFSSHIHAVGGTVDNILDRVCSDSIRTKSSFVPEDSAYNSFL